MQVTRVICQDCEFVVEIKRGDDQHPVDEMNKHERETGHKLRKERGECERGLDSQ